MCKTYKTYKARRVGKVCGLCTAFKAHVKHSLIGLLQGLIIATLFFGFALLAGLFTS